MARGQAYRSAYLTGGRGRRPGHSGFWVEWYEPRLHGAGPLRRRRAKFPSRQLALRFCRQKTDEINSPLFGEFPWVYMIDRYAEACAHLAAATQYEYTATLEKFARAAGAVQQDGRLVGGPAAHQITASLIQRFLTTLAATLSPDGVQKHFRQLRAFLNYGLEQEPPWFARDPSRGARLHAAAAVRLVETPTAGDVAALLWAAPKSDDPLGWYLAVRIAFETALRQDDVVGLTWAQVLYRENPDTGQQVFVIDTTAQKTGKRGLWCVTADLEAAIDARRQQCGATSPTLLGWNRFSPKKWKRLKTDAGQAKWNYHDLRGAAATFAQLLEEGAARAARLLDHSSPAVTRHHYLDRLRFAARYAQCLAAAQLPGWAQVDSGSAASPAPPAGTPARGPADR